MSIKTFADEMAALVVAGVTTRYDGIPKQLAPAQLPVKWVEMPSAVVEPTGNYGTLAESGSRYTVMMYIAVSAFDEGFPDAQRSAVLDIAAAVEDWVEEKSYTAEINTQQPVAVANIPYRGVTVRVTADAMT